MSKTFTSPAMRLLLGLVLLLTIGVAGLKSLPTHAQSPVNLLLNPSFDQAATARNNVSGEVPINWEAWSVESIHSETDEFWSHVRSDPSAWTFRRDYAAFTGGGYQIVTVQPDKAYRFSIFAYIWTCNETAHACATGTGGFSQPESGGKVRVGIDPTGGRDPNSPNVIWSNFSAPHPNHPPSQKIPYEMLSVDARSVGTQLTVFMYFTTQAAMRWNEVHFDDSSLVEISAVGVPVVGTAVPGATVGAVVPTSQFVPFVVPQQARADGSLVHKVTAGDTLSSILFAYSEYGVTRQDLLTYNNWRFEPQFIIVGDELVILPPGSIDPATGTLLSGGSAGTTLVAPTQAAAATEVAPAATAGVSSEVVTDAPVATTPPPAETTIAPEATTPPAAVVPVDRAAVQAIDNFLPTGSLPH